MRASPAASRYGIRTMAGQEFRLRLRAGRWRWLIGAWFAVLTTFMVLLRIALQHSGAATTFASDPSTSGPSIAIQRPLGTPMFGGLMLFVLGLALLVVPALTAQSVNGDRDRGVLAVLQTTLLTPAEIALGKLLAAWATALAFLAACLPLVVWSMVEGGVEIRRAVVSLLIVALLLGVVCAVAQCLSAMLSRVTTSAVLSYLFVFALSIGTPIAYALALVTTNQERTVTQTVPVFDADGQPTGQTEQQTFRSTQTDSSKVWWLLAPNPLVILADAAPRPQLHCDRFSETLTTDSLDPLGLVSEQVRQARTPNGADTAGVACASNVGGFAGGPVPTDGGGLSLRKAGPVWPYGLAFDLALGIAGCAVTIRRLRTPTRKLPTGVRVA